MASKVGSKRKEEVIVESRVSKIARLTQEIKKIEKEILKLKQEEEKKIVFKIHQDGELVDEIIMDRKCSVKWLFSIIKNQLCFDPADVILETDSGLKLREADYRLISDILKDENVDVMDVNISFLENLDAGDNEWRGTILEINGDRCVVETVCDWLFKPTRTLLVYDIKKA